MKKFIRRVLNRFGYEIIKTDNWYASKSSVDKTVQVGNHLVIMPGNNTLLNTYAIYPDFNSNLGRLAAAMATKYPGMTVLDIGANVGDTISIIKTAVDIPVIGIEGDPVTFGYLKKNVGQFKQVSIVNTFLGERKEQVKAALTKSGWNTTLIPAETGGETVSLSTVDEVLSEDRFNDRVIKLLKTDIEGFDTIVLRGAYGTIKNFQPVIFFEYNRDNMLAIQEEGLSTILSFSAYGYDRIAFFDHRGRLLLVTSLSNTTEITNLHNYITGGNNLLGHLDVCIFHQQDESVAAAFLTGEEKYCGYYK
jgi:FkbM family methyltransferase